VAAVPITGAPLTFADVVAVARGGARVELTHGALAAMSHSRAQVDALAARDQPVYAISTGLGALAGTRIAAEHRSALQHALVRSHAAGMGEPVDAEVVRAMMLLRLRTLATGRCGARPAGRRRWPRCSTPGSRPRCPCTDRSAPAATWHPSRTSPPA
jgi:histidine ammonia-lyase